MRTSYQSRRLKARGWGEVDELARCSLWRKNTTVHSYYISVAGPVPLVAAACGYFKSDAWFYPACVLRLDLCLYSHPKD
jgi:hypothetical protein